VEDNSRTNILILREKKILRIMYLEYIRMSQYFIYSYLVVHNYIINFMVNILQFKFLKDYN